MNQTSPSSLQQVLSSVTASALRNRAMLFSLILITALAGFEMFNFSTTQFALTDLLGDVRFSGIRWATILALAFCGIDFAGIARLFTPEAERASSREAWYLFSAWLLAATMNAILTWWGVSMALANHTVNSTYIIDPNILSRGVPVFVAAVVWVTRFLLISMLSSAGFGEPAAQRAQAKRPRSRAVAAQPQPAPALRPTSNPLSATPARSRPPAAVSAAMQARSADHPNDSPIPQRMAPPARQPRPANEQPTPRAAPVRTAPAEPPRYPRPVTDAPREPTAQPTRPTVSQPLRSAPAPQNKPVARPVAKPRPSARPPQPPPPPEEPTLPEPEYVPDPFYSQMPSVYHSLSARADTPRDGSQRKTLL